jgi:hypothetical protein
VVKVGIVLYIVGLAVTVGSVVKLWTFAGDPQTLLVFGFAGFGLMLVATRRMGGDAKVVRDAR